MKVKLLHCTPLSVAIKAVSKPYSTENAGLSLLKKVICTLKHESVAEHITLSFEINGISRLCLQELSRHRIASLTVKSTRFTLDKMLSVLESLEIQDVAVMPEQDKELDNSLMTWVQYWSDIGGLLQHSIDLMNKYKEAGFPADYLKYFVVESLKTDLVWSINLRSFLNFLKLRCASNAHFEIRGLANELKKQACEVGYLKEIIELSLGVE